MTLKLRAALRRLRIQRQNRRLAVARNRLQEMRENARDLIRTQETLVATLSGLSPGAIRGADISREIERRAKAPLFA